MQEVHDVGEREGEIGHEFIENARGIRVPRRAGRRQVSGLVVGIGPDQAGEHSLRPQRGGRAQTLIDRPAAYVKDLDRVDLTALRIAFHGVALRRADDLPARWLALHASRADAVRAAGLLSPLFKDVIMPVTRNPFARNALIFGQMVKALEKSADE